MEQRGRPLLHCSSAPERRGAGLEAKLGLPHARSASARLELAPSECTPSDSGAGEKTRKPYTITKQRERWTDAEHALFLEALREHGRAWRHIEEHIGTKTAVQIRSHAQKFFAKLEREQASGNKSCDLPADLTIPPPRPKRKPARPYPKKSEPEVSGGNGGVGNGALGHSDNGFGSAPTATRLHSHHQSGHRHGHHGHQQRQHITGSVASPAPNRPPPTPSPSPGPQNMVSAPAMMGGMSAPYLQHGGPVWGHHGAHHSGVDAGVAAVAAAASAAAAAAAAAVVATADEATQAQLQADPPQGFPFFGMPPSALAHFAGQMQASPQLAGLVASHYPQRLQQAGSLGLQQQQAQQQPQPGGHHVKRPHATSPAAGAPGWGGPFAAAGLAAVGLTPMPSSQMEWTATSDPLAPLSGKRATSRQGSEGDGDSACSRETRSGQQLQLPSGSLRTPSGNNLTKGSGAVAAAAAVTGADAARTLQLARLGLSALGGYGLGGGATLSHPRAASMQPQWTQLPIAALLQAAAASSSLPHDALQVQAAGPPDAPMTYSHLFKPPYKAVAPDILQGRAERAGKLRTPRGPGGGAPSGEAANNGGSGRSDAAGAAAGAAGNNSSGNMSCDDCAAGTAAAAQQQTSGSGGCNNTEARAPVATAAAGKPDKPERRSDTPNGGAAGSNDSQDSLIKNGVGFGDDSDKAEGYGSNPTGNGSSDGLAGSNGNGNGSSDGADGAEAARKPSPPVPHGSTGDGTSKAPGRLRPGERAPEPEQCAGKAHAHAHAQAHPHAHELTHPSLPAQQLAALQGAGMMPPTLAAIAAASSNMSSWGALQGINAQQAATTQQGMNPFLVQAAAVGQGLNAAATGLNPAALSSLAGSGAGGLANPAAWAAAAAQLQAGDDLGGSGMSGCGIPGIPGFGAGNADAQHQALLEQMQAQRQASALYKHPMEGPHPAPGHHPMEGPHPAPGHHPAHSAFEPASQQAPPASFRKLGPAKQTTSGRFGGQTLSGQSGGRDRSGGLASGGSPHASGGSPPDRKCPAEDAHANEQLPSRPKASWPSLPGGLAIGGGSGDGGLGASSGSSNASAASGFQPYRADSGAVGAPSHLKRSISGMRTDVPPRKRLQSCNIDQLEVAK